tara:strand:+ start:61 stop:255 length:195 start_codon:yes stop_codon:yes gene_type:complete
MKKKNLYKYIKLQMKTMNEMLEEINQLDDDLFKHIALRRTREQYYNLHIKPLMLIYQASKKTSN